MHIVRNHKLLIIIFLKIAIFFGRVWQSLAVCGSFFAEPKFYTGRNLALFGGNLALFGSVQIVFGSLWQSLAVRPEK